MNTQLTTLLEKAQSELVEKVTHETILDYFNTNPIQSFLFLYNEFDLEYYIDEHYYFSKAFFDLSDKLSGAYVPTEIDDLLNIFIENETELNKYGVDYIETYNLTKEKISHKNFITYSIQNYIFYNLYLDDVRIINSLEEQFDIFIFNTVNQFLSKIPQLQQFNSFDDTYYFLAETSVKYSISSFKDLEEKVNELLIEEFA